MKLKQIEREVFASRLEKADLILLVSRRICAEVCYECGSARTGGDSCFCGKCLAQFPIVSNVGEPVNGWQYRIVQTKPAYGDVAFRVERTDAFPPERKGRTESLGWPENRAEGEVLCWKKIKRTMAVRDDVF